jgi:hypothetical protein|nr:MAG TPA: hypothetical protein [Caudoviricetes sp.]
MKEKIIDLETAILAESKEYNIPCWDFIDIFDEECSVMDFIGDNFEEKLEYAKDLVKYWRPPQSVLKAWLRKEHNIDVDVFRDSEVHYKDEIRWIVKVCDWNKIKIFKSSIADLKYPNQWHGIDFKSYEKALESGLIEALKIVKLAK